MSRQSSSVLPARGRLVDERSDDGAVRHGCSLVLEIQEQEKLRFPSWRLDVARAESRDGAASNAVSI